MSAHDDLLVLQREIFADSRPRTWPLPRIMPWLLDRRNLEGAWRRVAEADGARTPGQDGVTVRQLAPRHDRWLSQLSSRLYQGQYRPGSPRWIEVPKGDGRGGTRRLGILIRQYIDDVNAKPTEPVARGGDAGSGDGMQHIPTAGAEDDVLVDCWLRRRERLRAVLDQIAWRPADSNQVHYFAVLLMRLRQVVVEKMLPAWKELEDVQRQQAPAPLSDFTEWCVKWHPPEARERFKTSLPTLDAIWNELRPLVDRDLSRIDAHQLCICVGRLAGDGAVLATHRWNTWSKRAKEQVRSRLDRPVWDDVFGSLLTDRDGAPAAPEETGGK